MLEVYSQFDAPGLPLAVLGGPHGTEVGTRPLVCKAVLQPFKYLLGPQRHFKEKKAWDIVQHRRKEPCFARFRPSLNPR